MWYKPKPLIPPGTRIDFMSWRRIGFCFSGALTLLAIVFFFTHGLAYGIDFRGGILMEVRAKEGAADLAQMREKLAELGLGEHDLQGFGQPSDALIRIAQQPGGEAAQQKAVEKVRTALGPGFDYRRVEFVGPKVGDELVQAGIIAAVMAILGIMAYIWFRFEWQFALGAVATVFHDMITTIGLFAVTQMQFDLNTLAAILTIAGYSLNDTVVVYDRIREDLRKYKRMPLKDLFNLSLNETLSRTILTSLTTMLALIALVVFGGEVISGFSIAMIWGVIVGTYSTSFISVPLLLYMNLRRQVEADDVQATPAGKVAP
jgi:preprotein translocase SecF subunit